MIPASISQKKLNTGQYIVAMYSYPTGQKWFIGINVHEIRDSQKPWNIKPTKS